MKTVEQHADEAQILIERAEKEADRVAFRESGAPRPFDAQRRGAQNALLILGWDHTAADILSPEEDGGLEQVEWSLAVAATNESNAPARRDRARAALIQVMALRKLVDGPARGRLA